MLLDYDVEDVSSNVTEYEFDRVVIGKCLCTAYEQSRVDY